MGTGRLPDGRRGPGLADRIPSPSRLRTTRVAIALTLVLGLAASATTSIPVRAQDVGPLLLPGGYPAAVTVDDVQYTFDRPSVIAADALAEAGTDGDLALLTRDGTDAVYATTGDGSTVRYVPSSASSPVNPCLAEQPGRGPLATSTATYAYAGLEPDLSPTELGAVPGASITIDDAPASLYVLPDSGDVPAEYWVLTGVGLERFVALDGAGLPPQIAGPVTVGDLDLADPVDVTGSVAVESLDRFGCAGPFPTFVDPAESTLAFVLVGEQLFSFTATQVEGDDGSNEGDEDGSDDGADGGSGDDAAEASDEVTGDVSDEASASGSPSTASGSEATPAATEEATDDASAEETPSPADGASPSAAASVASEDPSPSAGATGATPAGPVNVLPEGYPGNLLLAGGEYLFDRTLPLDPATLTEIETTDQGTVYGPADGATDRVFLSQDGGPLTRYLAVTGFDGVGTCLSEASSFLPLAVGDASYVFAGIEPDLTTADLIGIDGSFDIDGQSSSVFVDDTAADPLPELFADTPGGLYRFTLVDGDGVPLALSPSFAIGDQTATFDADVTGSVDLATLTRVGCAGPFPLYGSVDAAPYTELFVAVSQSVLRFDVTGGATPEPATPVPTETATIAPTATATVEPTATAEPTATVAPTATPEPTATATLEPTATATPEPTATVAPTATTAPTVAPTSTLAPTATPEPQVTSAVVAPTATVPPVVDPPATATVAPTAVPPTVAPTSPPTVAPTAAPPTVAPTSPPTIAPTAVPATVAPTGVPATAAPGQTPAPTAAPTRVLQPIAVIVTAPTEVPVAAETVEATSCTGPIGNYAADGFPELLPRQIQLSGVAYRSTGFADPETAGALTRIGCVGGFNVVSSDQLDPASTLFLQVPETSGVSGQETLFRYDVAITFTVQVESPSQPALISDGTSSYTASAAWVQSTYSSVTVELYVASAGNPSPDLIYALRVDGGVIGSYALATADEVVADEAAVAAGAPAGLNPDLTIAGQRYVLTAVFTPAGTTTNGFVTLYADAANPDGTRLLGIDPRDPRLLIFERPA